MDIELILGLIFWGVMGGFIIVALIIAMVEKRRNRSDNRRCKACRGNEVPVHSSLYLLPVRFNYKHDESAAWYARNGQYIQNVEQIPTGVRAFRLTVYRCAGCGKQEVLLVDFLRVRNEESVQSVHIFPYEEFQGLLQGGQYGRV
ncbi:MAG: hypothetical protein J1E83_02495 [Lachnospiraceae bacterium]|nr:hypothetical protein [Lachnospiraceae bacterium]